MLGYIWVGVVALLATFGFVEGDENTSYFDAVEVWLLLISSTAVTLWATLGKDYVADYGDNSGQLFGGGWITIMIMTAVFAFATSQRSDEDLHGEAWLLVLASAGFAGYQTYYKENPPMPIPEPIPIPTPQPFVSSESAGDWSW